MCKNFKIFKLLSPVFYIAILLLLFSCENNINEVRKKNIVQLNPIGEAKDFNLKHTDSGKIKIILVSALMRDYSNLSFPFTEFPKGIKVTIYNDKKEKNYITSNYAVSYTKTKLIDLIGEVKIITADGKRLETEQLYFDQGNEWFFTQKKYKYINNGSVIEGKGIDFSKDFKTLDTQEITGVYQIEK